jgi:hypothetical protein
MRLLSVLLVISLFCCNGISTENTLELIKPMTSLIDTSGKFIITRFNCPDSFTRRSYDSSSFAFYLSHLKLKPSEAKVHLYDGTLKQNEAAYSAVVDMPISPKDLQQCADAVMRLRGEYLFNRKSYQEIAFRFLGDGKLHSYLDYAGSDRSYAKFIKYMDHVFMYANTGSLFAQLKPAPFYTIQPGDVLIQKGQPYGHAVIVVDMCYGPNGEKKFLLAQSYMPAQETQILRQPGNESCWYSSKISGEIRTPEWTFDTTDLRRW